MSEERIKIYLKTKPKNLLDFLSKFFLMRNAWTTSVETYFDEECKKVQCKTGIIRSFDDLYTCCLTYFPKTKPETLFKKLITTYIDMGNYNARIYFGRCNTIKRMTCYYMNGNLNNFKYFINLEQLESKYSYKELFNKLGINSQQDLNEYLKTHKQYEIK
jgi:hypothetical protein